MPFEASTTTRVQVSDAADSTFSDLSDGTFTLRRPAPQVFVNAYLPHPNFRNGGDGLRFNRGVNDGSSGDSVYLLLPDGTVQDSPSDTNTYQGVSYNRNPDASATGTECVLARHACEAGDRTPASRSFT